MKCHWILGNFLYPAESSNQCARWRNKAYCVTSPSQMSRHWIDFVALHCVTYNKKGRYLLSFYYQKYGYANSSYMNILSRRDWYPFINSFNFTGCRNTNSSCHFFKCKHNLNKESTKTDLCYKWYDFFVFEPGLDQSLFP